MENQGGKEKKTAKIWDGPYMYIGGHETEKKV